MDYFLEQTLLPLYVIYDEKKNLNSEVGALHPHNDTFQKEMCFYVKR